jgi:apolipoprotein N-acyltransferase
MTFKDSLISALLIVAVIVILILFLLLGWWIGSLILPMLAFSGWLNIFAIIIQTVVGLLIIGVFIVIVGYIALKLI